MLIIYNNKMSVARNPNLGPSQIRARRRRLFFVRFFIILFFLLVIILSLAILSGHEKVKIKNIVILNNAAVSSSDILAIVNRDITGRYLYLFSKSNSLIFPRFKIRDDLLSELKAIKDVNISFEDWQKISISVEERKPHSVWCGVDVKAVEPQCFFVDKEGYIYSQAPTFSGSVYVKDYGSPLLMNASTSDPIGHYFLSKDVYSQIYNFIQILDQNNLKVISLSFDGFDYKLALESGPIIIFNNKNDFNLSFQNLFTAIQTKNLDLINDTNTINYIDLRFDNKIVVGKK